MVPSRSAVQWSPAGMLQRLSILSVGGT